MHVHGFLMARLGAGLADVGWEQYVSEVEEDLLSWQEYAVELEKRLKNLEERYNELAVNAGRLVEYTKLIQREKDHRHEENGRLRKIIADLRSQDP